METESYNSLGGTVNIFPGKGTFVMKYHLSLKKTGVIVQSVLETWE